MYSVEDLINEEETLLVRIHMYHMSYVVIPRG